MPLGTCRRKFGRMLKMQCKQYLPMSIRHCWLFDFDQASCWLWHFCHGDATAELGHRLQMGLGATEVVSVCMTTVPSKNIDDVGYQ